ncbi:MAG TPA: tetratricopeptide repeat protein [bacterium]|nr:tetratricopeptide repeat protein [bacterium]
MKNHSLKSFFFAIVALLGMAASQARAQATANQYLTAANQFYNQKNYTQAAVYYRAAAQVDPNNAVAYQGLGSCQYAQGQKAEALASYERSLVLNPNNPPLANFVQSLRAQVGTSPAAQYPASSGSSGIAQDVLASPSNAYAVPGAQEAVPNNPNNPNESNSWTAGHSHDRNNVDIFLGPVFYSGMTGFGLGSTYNFPIDNNFEVGIGSNLYFFSQTLNDQYGYSYTNIQFFTEGLLLAKYLFGNKKDIRPFAFGGGGLDALVGLNTGSNGYGGSSFGFDPMLQLGGGVNIPLGTSAAFFLQGKISLVFGGINSSTSSSGTQTSGGGGSFSYIPLEAGFSLPL